MVTYKRAQVENRVRTFPFLEEISRALMPLPMPPLHSVNSPSGQDISPTAGRESKRLKVQTEDLPQERQQQQQPAQNQRPPTPPASSCSSSEPATTPVEPMAQLNPLQTAFSPPQHGAEYTIQEAPLGSARHVRVVCVGAGASGLSLIRALRLQLTEYEITVYEKNADVGGTWLVNRYPGCRCDVPSHSYQFSWRQKKDWSNFFSPAEEIGAYLCQVCEEEKMGESIKTLHQVVSAQWDEKEGQWELVVRNLETGEEFSDSATFLVDGTGILK